MKTSRTILLTYLSIFLVFNAIVVAVFAVPDLEAARQGFADRLGLESERSLMIAAWALTALASAFIAMRLASALYRPFHRLAHFISKNQHTIALQLEDTFKEERVIKRFMDSQDMRVIDAESQVEEMEAQTVRKLEQMNDAIEDAKQTESRMGALEEAQRKLRLDNEILKAAKEASDYALDFERKSKVGAEVEKRTEEIYRQMEQAVLNAALRSIWQPSRLYELKIQTRIIEKTAERLQKYWKEISMAQLQEDLGEIQTQSQKQLNLIEALSKLEPPKLDPAFEDITIRQADLVGEVSSEDEEEATPLPAHGEGDEEAALSTDEYRETDATASERAPGKNDIDEANRSTGRDDLFDYLKDLLADISPHQEHVKIRLEVGPEIDTPEDRETLSELLTDLINLGARRVDHGRITLKAEERRDAILFSIYVDGTPNPDFELDLDHARQLLSDLENSVTAEEDRGHLLTLRYEHHSRGAPVRSGSHS